MTWLQENAANLIVGGVVLALVVFAVARVIINKRRNPHGCTGCSGCGHDSGHDCGHDCGDSSPGVDSPGRDFPAGGCPHARQQK